MHQEEIEATHAPKKVRKKKKTEEVEVVTPVFPILKTITEDYCRKAIAMAKKYLNSISQDNTKIVELELNEKIEEGVDIELFNSEYVIIISMPKWGKNAHTLKAQFQTNHKLVLNIPSPISNGKTQTNYTIFLYKKIQ